MTNNRLISLFDQVARLATGDFRANAMSGILLAFWDASIKLMDTKGGAPTVYIGEIADFIARAIIKSEGEQHRTAQEARFEAYEAAKADLESQADASRSAADKMQSGAIASLVTGVVGGSVGVLGNMTSAVGSLKSVTSMGKSIASTEGLSSKITEQQQIIDSSKTVLGTQGIDPTVAGRAAFDKTSAETAMGGLLDQQSTGKSTFELAQSKGQFAGAVGQVAGTAGEIAHTVGSTSDSQMQAQARREDAEGSKDAARAEFRKQIADAEKAMEDSLYDTMKQSIALIKDIQDAKMDAMRAATRV